MNKIIASAIVLSMILPSGALFAKERRGALLVITKTDGTEKKGELIGVKQDSTLLLESSSGISESIGVSEAKVIKIIKGSNTVEGVFLGLLAGYATGAIIGKHFDKGYKVEIRKFPSGAGIGGGIGLIVGGILGGLIGSFIYNYETFQIEGKSQEQIKAFLEKLRTQARFPEYQ